MKSLTSPQSSQDAKALDMRHSGVAPSICCCSNSCHMLPADPKPAAMCSGWLGACACGERRCG
jgi:hypothetical protein